MSAGPSHKFDTDPNATVEYEGYYSPKNQKDGDNAPDSFDIIGQILSNDELMESPEVEELILELNRVVMTNGGKIPQNLMGRLHALVQNDIAPKKALAATSSKTKSKIDNGKGTKESETQKKTAISVPSTDKKGDPFLSKLNEYQREQYVVACRTIEEAINQITVKRLTNFRSNIKKDPALEAIGYAFILFIDRTGANPQIRDLKKAVIKYEEVKKYISQPGSIVQKIRNFKVVLDCGKVTNKVVAMIEKQLSNCPTDLEIRAKDENAYYVLNFIRMSFEYVNELKSLGLVTEPSPEPPRRKIAPFKVQAEETQHLDFSKDLGNGQNTAQHSSEYRKSPVRSENGVVEDREPSSNTGLYLSYMQARHRNVVEVLQETERAETNGPGEGGSSEIQPKTRFDTPEDVDLDSDTTDTLDFLKMEKEIEDEMREIRELKSMQNKAIWDMNRDIKQDQLKAEKEDAKKNLRELHRVEMKFRQQEEFKKAEEEKKRNMDKKIDIMDVRQKKAQERADKKKQVDDEVMEGEMQFQWKQHLEEEKKMKQQVVNKVSMEQVKESKERKKLEKKNEKKREVSDRNRDRRDGLNAKKSKLAQEKEKLLKDMQLFG